MSRRSGWHGSNGAANIRDDAPCATIEGVLSSLAGLVRSSIAGGPPTVEGAIFATTDPDRIAAMVALTVSDLAGAPADGCLFFAASAGCVVGVHLADGRSVVLKAYQSHWEEPFLRAVQRVQGAVASRGFPCPQPLSGPVPLGHGWATLESYLADPGHPTPLDDHALTRSSAGLVDLMGAARGLAHDGLEQHPFRIAAGDLYPTPHHPVFDFHGTARGAEWIDEWANRAWAGRSAGTLPPVICHLDWSARNVRLGPTGVVAVYDWDSIGTAPEAVAAGQNAVTWRTTGETFDGPAPDAGEVTHFIDCFGRARGAALSAEELDVARAAAVWVMAYTARCEHALEERAVWRSRRARDWLRTQAAILLP
jgi:hypothetical protein